MKSDLKPNCLKFLIPGCGVLGFALRFLLFATGTDGRGLLVRNHPAAIALWVLTAAVGAVLLFFGRHLEGPTAYADAHPVSFAAFLGCLAAAGGVAVTGAQSFGDFTAALDVFIWVLTFAAAACLACVGVCRLLRLKPYFLLHVVVCIYFALRLVTLYRRWSFDPCLHDYFFHLGAYLFLMLTAYHHAAFDAAMGSHRALWFCSLAGVYLCCTALYACQEPLLTAGCAIWCITGLTNLTVKERRVRPALNLDADEAQGA